MKSILKNILGNNISKVRPFYHGLRSILASIYFGFPSYKLKIIAITGTKGKTSTTVTTGRIMNLLDLEVGYLSTAAICLDGNLSSEFINPHKNTTLDAFLLQKFLAKMVKNGCKYAVLEISSIGLQQNRHLGINSFDTATLLNMYPEHIEYHGSWEKYKAAKSKILEKLKVGGYFICTDEESQLEIKNYFYQKLIKLKKDKIKKNPLKLGADYDILKQNGNLKLDWRGKIFKTNYKAPFQITNLVFALEIIQNYLSLEKIQTKLPKVLESLPGIPGRMDFVVEGEELLNNKVSILVDYAHEPESMKQLLTTLLEKKMQKEYSHIIHILSCDGAGRDDWKKPIMGEISQKYADITILTTDNYDKNDNPKKIIELLAKNLTNETGHTLFTEIDRKEAFKKSLEIATKLKLEKLSLQQKILPAKVLIVSTGVGSEQQLTQPKGPIKWDEREVWKKIFLDYVKTTEN